MEVRNILLNEFRPVSFLQFQNTAYDDVVALAGKDVAFRRSHTKLSNYLLWDRQLMAAEVITRTWICVCAYPWELKISTPQSECTFLA